MRLGLIALEAVTETTITDENTPARVQSTERKVLGTGSTELIQSCQRREAERARRSTARKRGRKPGEPSRALVPGV